MLEQLASFGIGARPIAMVTHSLGGILAKMMLRASKECTDHGWKRIAENTRLVAFLSTPHTGAALGAVVKFFIPDLASAHVDILSNSDGFLTNLNHSYRELAADGIETFSYYEKYKTKNFFLVVSPESADPGVRGRRPLGMDADHISICKPERRESPIFSSLCYRITQVLQSCPPRRSGADTTASGADTHSSILAYHKTTEIDVRCFDDVMQGSNPPAIQYHSDVARAVELLAAYDRDPSPLLKHLSYVGKQTLQQRRTTAAAYHSRVHDLNLAVQRSIRTNRDSLQALVGRLKDDGISSDLARETLKGFGRFAALRLIRQLQELRDVSDAKHSKRFFDHYSLGESDNYCYLERAPTISHTGKTIFGYRYYLGARIADSYRHELYDYVMLPLDIANAIMSEFKDGDADTFYVWVLPQLYVIRRSENVDAFKADRWTIIELFGKYGQGQETSGEVPWRGCFG
jgi:hypothetical protein